MPKTILKEPPAAVKTDPEVERLHRRFGYLQEQAYMGARCVEESLDGVYDICVDEVRDGRMSRALQIAVAPYMGRRDTKSPVVTAVVKLVFAKVKHASTRRFTLIVEASLALKRLPSHLRETMSWERLVAWWLMPERPAHPRLVPRYAEPIGPMAEPPASRHLPMLLLLPPPNMGDVAVRTQTLYAEPATTIDAEFTVWPPTQPPWPQPVTKPDTKPTPKPPTKPAPKPAAKPAPKPEPEPEEEVHVYKVAFSGLFSGTIKITACNKTEAREILEDYDFCDLAAQCDSCEWEADSVSEISPEKERK